MAYLRRLYFVFGVLVASAVALICPWRAAAMTQTQIYVKPGTKTTARFPPIAGQDADRPHLVPYPTVADCRDASECDVIPVQVLLPADFDQQRDEAVTHVSLVGADPTTGDDLNLYSFDRDQHLSEKSTSTGSTEHVNAADDQFFVVVVNQNGVNSGYTLSFEWERHHYSGSIDGPEDYGVHKGPVVVIPPSHSTRTSVYGNDDPNANSGTIFVPPERGDFEAGLGPDASTTRRAAPTVRHASATRNRYPVYFAAAGALALAVGAVRIWGRSRRGTRR